MEKYQQAIEQQDKSRIYELMRQGEPIPPDLLPALADALESKGKRGRPSKKFYGVHEQEFLKEFSRRVDYMNLYDDLMELAEREPVTGETAHQTAVNQMAGEFHKTAESITRILNGNRTAI